MINVREFIEQKRSSINRSLDVVNDHYDDIIIESSTDYIIDDAMDQFELTTLQVFGDYYKNELIFEEMLYDAKTMNELEVVEEAILDSLADLKNRVITAIKNLWTRFKDWMMSIIESIKDIFSGSNGSSSQSDGTKADDSKKSGEPKGGSDTGGTSKPKSEDKKMPDLSVLDKKKGDPTPIKRTAAGTKPKSIDMSYARTISRGENTNRKNLEANYNAQKNSLSLYCYVYRNETDKMMKLMDAGIDINDILYAKKMSKDAYYDMLKGRIGGDPRDKEGFLRPYIVGMIRDNEKGNHVVGDIPLFIIRGYASDTADIMNKCQRMLKQYKELYDNVIASIKNSEEAKRISYIKTIAMQATNFGTFSIKVFTNEFKHAAKQCRSIVKKLSR